MKPFSVIRAANSSGSASAAGLNVVANRDSPALAWAYDELSIRQLVQGKTLISALNVSRGENVLDVGVGTS
jgi:ubiquinone/menaquinone biosynthesis C-methylase UbiE